MNQRKFYLIPVMLVLLPGFFGGTACQNNGSRIRPGAEHLERILPMLEGRNVALVVNQTSMVGETHLLDTLLGAGIRTGQVWTVFSAEHGFLGNFSAGSHVDDFLDPETGITFYSLYGSRKKPEPGQLEGIEKVVFDIQDVGTRFYTYISTLHYVMESCAENGIPLIVLDRPNPNGGYVDGPLLEPEFASFVGMDPIPVVYGLTIGELAMMINGEGWLKGGIRCDLQVVPCTGYRHGDAVSLPVAPSPNLTNDHAISLYPSTCFFEGTVVSEGRGTPYPFEVFGHPDLPGSYTFVPESIEGVSEHPKLLGRGCHGSDLRDFVPAEGWNRIHLSWLLESYHDFPDKEAFFTPYFDKLAGTSSLRRQIEAGWSEEQIRDSWAAGLDSFLTIRSKYLLYP